MKLSWSFARVSLGDEMNTCGRPSGCIGQSPTLGYQARPPPSSYYSAETAVLTFPRFPLRKKQHTSYFGKNRTHDFRTSRCAGYLLDHYQEVNYFNEINNYNKQLINLI